MINGICESCMDQRVYISTMSENGEIIDTVKMIKGSYELKKKITHEEWIQIRYEQKSSYLELFTKPNETINIKSNNYVTIDSSIIQGSPSSIDRNNYINKIQEIGNKRKTIIRKTHGSIANSENEINLDGLDLELEEYTFKLIINTHSFLLKELCLIGINSNIYLNEIKKHIDTLEERFESNYDFRHFTKTFRSKFQYTNSVISEIPFNSRVKGFNDQEIRLNDFQTKYIFIVFWASWSKQSRALNYEFINNDYIAKNTLLFPLLVSLDYSENNWKKAIAEDQLMSANHSIDYPSFKNSFAKKIGITSITTNFLIDPNGHIILQNATPEDVKAFLDKLK
ncbi:TlpA family protein disulfide reductase [Haliscomenobacter sp.]|uniref:TlpA family protein disulfide reductase n=1 Tax=Haliscomenobacter sp. TaxID=2717303 RepID=UPI0035932C6E